MAAHDNIDQRRRPELQLDDADKQAVIHEIEAMMDREILLRRVCLALHAPSSTEPLPSAFRRYYVNASYEASMLKAQIDALATAIYPDLLTPADESGADDSDNEGEGMEDPAEMDDLAGVRAALSDKAAARIVGYTVNDTDNLSALRAEWRALVVAFALIGVGSAAGAVVRLAARLWR